MRQSEHSRLSTSLRRFPGWIRREAFVKNQNHLSPVILMLTSPLPKSLGHRIGERPRWLSYRKTNPVYKAC